MKFKAEKNWMGPGWHVIDTETDREIAWVYDQAKGETGPNEARAKLFAGAELLRDAIVKTLDDNAHLADGDVCTLYTLKVALRELGCPWDGDEKTS